MIERLKKVRGFKSMHPKKNVVRLSDLENKFKDGETVSIESLVKAGLISKKDVRAGAKILSTGTISKKVIIAKDILLSQTAKDAIIKAGGTINE